MFLKLLALLFLVAAVAVVESRYYPGQVAGGSYEQNIPETIWSYSRFRNKRAVNAGRWGDWRMRQKILASLQPELIHRTNS